ncbi:MAG: ribosome recycling factor [Planctomycetota bacterium]|jgi:ribosome recycling factor
MATNKIVSEHEAKMKKAVEVLQSNLKALRSGRASTGLVENLKVNYYGSPTPLKQLATLATPQSDLIVIKPFDPSSLKEIEKAIKNTDLSIAPIVEGKMIRLNIPPLSQERRGQLVAQAKQNGEQTKVSIRNIRRDANKQLEREEKKKVITEDERDESKKRIDDITKEYSARVDAIVKAKTDEIMFD